MVELLDVHKSFGRVHAVRGVTLQLDPGQVVGLLGPNGAGKTTAIRMMTSYLPPDQGRARVGGHDTLDDAASARRLVGYLPESAPLYTEMLVSGYLHYRARLYGLDRAARVAAVERVIDRCWLKDARSRRIGTLSKGYRQRVGLAAAILHDPKFVVLDEPTNGLDPTQVVETRRLVRELAADRTLLVSSHVLGEIERTCQRVVIMIAGRVRADGSPESLVAGSSRQARYTMELKSPAGVDPAVFAGTALGVEGIASASATALSDGWHRVEAQSQSPHDLREALAAAARSAGLLTRELSRHQPSLEQFFVDLIDQTAESGVGSGTRSRGQGAAA